MGITLIIVAGVVVATVVSTWFDYLGKKAKGGDGELAHRVAELERRLGALDALAAEKDERINQLEQEVRFVNKLLDKKD
jgi:hypothetical protein